MQAMQKLNIKMQMKLVLSTKSLVINKMLLEWILYARIISKQFASFFFFFKLIL